MNKNFENEKREAIKAYLKRNIIEYANCKEKIFAELNLGYSTLIEEMMFRLAKHCSSFYLQFTDKKLTLAELENCLKREIRILLRQEADKYGFDPIKKKGGEGKYIAYLFNYISPVFLVFKNPEDLNSVIFGASILAEEHRTSVKYIFMEKERHNLLLRFVYRNPAHLKKIMQRMLSVFSVEEIIKRITGTKNLPLESLEVIDKLLDKCREKIKRSPVQQVQMQKIQAALGKYIENRIKEIYN